MYRGDPFVDQGGEGVNLKKNNLVLLSLKKNNFVSLSVKKNILFSILVKKNNLVQWFSPYAVMLKWKKITRLREA